MSDIFADLLLAALRFANSLHAGHVLALLTYGAMIGVLRGVLGGGAGLRDLFREQAAHVSLFDTPGHARWQLWLSPGFTTMALFTLWIGVTLALLEMPPRLFDEPQDMSLSGRLWAVALMWVLAGLALWLSPAGEGSGGGTRRVAGLLVGGLAAMLVAQIMRLAGPEGAGSAGLALAMALLAMIVAMRLWVQTGAAWFMLLIVLTTAVAFLAEMPVGVLVLAVALGTALLVRWLVPFRQTIPGIPARRYARPIRPNEPHPEPDLPPAPLIAPEAALEAWRSRLEGAQEGRKPRLVLLALSGGGYRATFWTAAVLDALFRRDGHFAVSQRAETSQPEERLDGLAESVRVIAGASGGMVTGAYVAELSARQATGSATGSLVGILENDIAAFQAQDPPIRPPGMLAPRAHRVPIPRDSLSAVAWQLLRDLAGVFRPWATTSDRGRVLEAQWPTLSIPFNDVRQQEADGLRPSLIFSPMLVESGAPVFISNLRLAEFRTHYQNADGSSDADEHSAELFRILPEAYGHTTPNDAAGLTIATAARLSATFPYVLPAVSLPCKPHRRVVDAGYYDNYGIDVVTGLLNSDTVRDWVISNCSGVLVIALRAFPDQPTTTPTAPLSRLFWWLTSPVEGMFNARGSSQTFRNREQLRLTRKIYGAALAALAPDGAAQAQWQQAGRDFVDIVTFTCDTDASMSWHLSDADMATLREAAEAITDPDAPEMARLLRIWGQERPPSGAA